ncbi:DUF3592 domain-containing protein [Sphingobacterium shayense]|uniref:DUF3592 domain-containing protein n=1 Tax=Sphingobacterium shayense TaxID=626343 RepID=UPI001556B488|nr:DUF3592 domain-containing protein [Sphingobacterium shayense]NQD71468.1 DUF3592 domain-containing protein [Sphingobacterium shayense]
MGVAIHGLLVLIGLALVALGIQMFLSSRQFREAGIRTFATVSDNIAMESRDNSGTSIMYAPLLEYIVNGEKKTYTPNARSNPPAYNIGEKVPIVYSPKNHQNVRIISYWGIYLGSNILLAFGMPILVIGCGYFLFKWGII